MNGGRIVASILEKQRVKQIFTLIGGHISPILTESKALGIRVIDVRHEANAVFAADATARLTGIPGVAVVTAGPGVTNTITAVKNAQMAQSPVVLLGGSAATILKGRGALQDIDQLSLMKSVVKWQASVTTISDLAPAVHKAFRICQQDTPGPVFVELPIDLLYEESVVREWYGVKSGKRPKSLGERALQWYLDFHLWRQFAGQASIQISEEPIRATYPRHKPSQLLKVQSLLRDSERPVIIIGSQATLDPRAMEHLKAAIEQIGAPIYLSGMARGLMGKDHLLQRRHKRRNALKEADLVLLAGVPCDFRSDYGRHIRQSSIYVSVNRDRQDLYKNRRPTVPVLADPAEFLIDLGHAMGPEKRASNTAWHAQLLERDREREQEIDEQAKAPVVVGINPLQLFRELDPMLDDDDSVIVLDGGDFVGTASYTLRPRGALSWLDPGAFGTLGVGGGFALGAKLTRPSSETWIIWGDGSSAFSLAEFDTFARHGIPVIGVVGNDACWSQIARDQVDILGDDTGCALAYTDYQTVAVGYGGMGRRVNNIADFKEAIKEAKAAVREGKSYLINAVIGKTDFRKGSTSV